MTLLQGIKFQRFQGNSGFAEMKSLFKNRFHAHHGDRRGKFLTVIHPHIREDEMLLCRHKRFKEKESPLVGRIGIVALEIFELIKGIAVVHPGELPVVQPQYGDDFGRDRPQGNQGTKGDFVTQKMLFAAGKRVL